MKINELKTSHAKHLIKNAWKLPDDIENYLSDNGYKFIGRGFFSRVYGLPDSNAVIKVSNLNDKGWLEFVDFCKSYKSKHLPKISRVIKYKGPGPLGGRTLFIAFMEKLDPLENINYFSHIDYENVFKIIKYLDKEQIQAAIVRGREDSIEYINMIINNAFDRELISAAFDDYVKLFKIHPEFIDLCYELKTFAKKKWQISRFNTF